MGNHIYLFNIIFRNFIKDNNLKISSNNDNTKMISQFYLYDKYASIYYAYNAIHRYMVCKNHNLNNFC